ncbi:hypothetical protein BCF46_2668 [Litoreibacter meonggei]|uniref:Uncharacterized protein n=1 Tax=Litoreibacter meonggei TaxID=1049199 RepID=A0A497VDK9_9RHOB|nr:hypothetical protein [Litoreibacter meonggei]RLJ41701.1 hypothetical protein BCF46_2668 [Litoreibacter meonggei]
MSMADASFQERLARINAGQGYVAEGLLGNGELDTIRKRQETGKGPKPVATMGIQEKKKFPLKKVIVAFVLGVVSFFGGSLSAFHATQGVATEFDNFRLLVEALGPVGMSAVLAFFLLYVSGLRSVILVGVIMAGFFAVHFAEPHMARAAPELWTQMYSAEYADALKFQAFAQTTQWGFAPPPELVPQPEPAPE